nr:CopG family transcriptional regulator [uncultured Pseudomonas sp.]
MSTILADLTSRQLEDLNHLASALDTSRAALIREAVTMFVAVKTEELKHPAPDVFGLCSNRAVDGLAYEQELRNEW